MNTFIGDMFFDLSPVLFRVGNCNSLVHPQNHGSTKFSAFLEEIKCLVIF